MTPSGVEQITPVALANGDGTVNPTMTPSGVEQLNAGPEKLAELE